MGAMSATTDPSPMAAAASWSRNTRTAFHVARKFQRRHI